LQGAIVPGGQNYFVQTNGALAYTQPHDRSMPNLLSVESFIYDGAVGGAFFGPGGVSWKACPVVISNGTVMPAAAATAAAANATTGVGGAAGGIWQVYANIANVTLPTGCTGFDALVHDLPADTRGAWEYV